MDSVFYKGSNCYLCGSVGTEVHHIWAGRSNRSNSERRGFKVKRNGDDLFVNDKKLSVSIATKSLTSVLIHTGINILSEGAPIAVSGLESDLGIKDIKEFALEVMKRYSDEIDDIILASTKVRGV